MKQTIKRTLCLVCACAMLFGLCACGSQPQSEATPTAAPDELVYTGKFTALPVTPENGLSTLAYTDDGLYAQTWEKIGEREIPEGAEIRYEGEYDLFGPALYFVSYDGTARRLEKYQTIPVPEDDQDRMDYYGSSSLERMMLQDDGTLIVLESQYINWYDGPESERFGDNQWEYRINERHYYLRKLDADGSELSRAELELPDEQEDSYLNTYGCLLDSSGSLLIIEEQHLLSYAQDGTLNYMITCDEYPETLVRLRDGELAVSCWGDTGAVLYLVDTEKHELGEKLDFPPRVYNFLNGGGDFDLYYTNGTNLYGFCIGDEEGTKLLNWINVDVNPDRLSGYTIDGDGNIRGLISDWSGDRVSNELVLLERVPASTLPVKQELRLAVLYLDYQAQQKIIDFNRHSSTTRILVQDYSEFDTEDDYSAGLTKLTTEILAGNIPDLLGMNQLPYDQLASKGLLEDLYPYLDADEELSRSDFFPTVLSAMEYNGGLYQVAPSFQILTLIGASSVVGDTPGWTYDDFNAALASMPAGCSPLDQYTTREDVLRSLVSLEMDRLVNWATGECHFDSQDFIDILNFSNRFQADFDWDSYEWSVEESTENRIAEGRQMLMTGNIYSVDDLLYNDFYFGGESTYIGYPTSEGVGSMMSLTSGFAMSSRCADKAAGWAFLRTVLSEEYQRDVWGLPINKVAFDAKLQEAMTPEYQTDADGNYVLDENGERIQISRGGIGMADGSVYYFYALTQEQADKLLDVINSTTRVMNSNDSLLALILEEAQPFYAGQKSAEEVARLTQSKVKLYVNEQR